MQVSDGLKNLIGRILFPHLNLIHVALIAANFASNILTGQFLL